MTGSDKPLFSRFRAANDLVYSSGLTSTPGDAPTQIRGCFEKVRGVLAEAGLTMSDVVKVNVYLANLADREAHLNPIWRECFPDNPPCRTTVQCGLGGALVEVDVVAGRKR